MALKLHFGCGDRKITLPDWVNVDSRPDMRPDVCCDIKLPIGFWACNSVDTIYASHVVEHFTRKELVNVLKQWRALLMTGGCLRISVPDFRAIALHYIEFGHVDIMQHMLTGRHEHANDFHYWVFDKKLLKSKLVEAGFSPYHIREYDWRQTEHAAFDDHASSYFPHMDKIAGRLMSLNLEAFKTDD